MDETPQNTGSSLLDYSTTPNERQQAMTSNESQQTMTNQQGSEDTAQENQQLADAGEFDQLAEAGEFEKLSEKVNSDLTKIDMQGDEISVKTIECLRVIANDGIPEHRTWASQMLNWHSKMLNWRNELAIYLKSLKY